jgi:putative regulator of septum formation
MSQKEPPETTPGGLEPPARPPSGGPPTEPTAGDGAATPAPQPSWPDAGVGGQAGGGGASGQSADAVEPPNAAPAAADSLPGSTLEGGWTPSGVTPPADWTSGAAARPAGRFRLLPRLIIPGIIVVVLVVGFLFRDRISGQAADLKTGDCFDDPITAGQSGAEVKDVQHHPCTEPHLFEVIATFKYQTSGDAAFPGQTGFDSFILEKCSAAFGSYVGITEDQSSLAFSAYTPVESGWKKGDRDITCFLGAPDGSKLTGSMKNAQR